MSLISKTTWCFNCGKSGFGNRELHPIEMRPELIRGYEVAKDRCKACGAFKNTLLGTKYKAGLGAGAVTYFKPINHDSKNS